MLEEALAAAYTLESAYSRTVALRQLYTHLSIIDQRKVLREALIATREIDDEHYATSALRELAPYLPLDLSRIGQLHSLEPELTNWVSYDQHAAHSAFSTGLSMLATRPRPEFLCDLDTLMPFILALAGDEAPQTAAGIYQAIQEACGGWP